MRFFKSAFAGKEKAVGESLPSLTDYVNLTVRQVVDINIAKNQNGCTDPVAVENRIVLAGFKMAERGNISPEEGIVKSCEILRDRYDIGPQSILIHKDEAQRLAFKGMEIL